MIVMKTTQLSLSLSIEDSVTFETSKATPKKLIVEFVSLQYTIYIIYPTF